MAILSRALLPLSLAAAVGFLMTFGFGAAMAQQPAAAGNPTAASPSGTAVNPGGTLPRHQVRMFTMVDQNKDGVVTHDEYMHYRNGLFARIDKNKDGAISRDEFMAWSRHGHDRMSSRGEKEYGAEFAAVNKSGSGSITKAEWESRSNELFALRDRKKDGKLTPDEFGPLMPRHNTAG